MWMLKFIYVNILPTILLDICGCNQICITDFPRNKKHPFAKSWFTNEAVKADLRVSAGLPQMIPIRDLVTNWNEDMGSAEDFLLLFLCLVWIKKIRRQGEFRILLCNLNVTPIHI